MNLDTGELKLNIPNMVVTGRSVSRGIGIGRAVCLYGSKRQFFKTKVLPEAVDSEIQRLREAVSIARGQLQAIVDDSAAGEAQTEIFESHLMLLTDVVLQKKTEDSIVNDEINCEWAVSKVIEEFSAHYKQISAEHVREKYIDVEDVGERLVSALRIEMEIEFAFEPDAIIVARELNPSTLIEIAAFRPAAIVTERGGWTSHAYILARELEIPAVTGISQLLRRTDTGAKLIVDGYKGEIVIAPSPEIEEKYRASVYAKPLNDKTPDVRSFGPRVKTLDNVDIRICANLDLVRKSLDVERIRKFGVGLYRSEYLFRRYSDYPSEEKQLKRYSEILNLAGESNVKVRTFDLSIGEFADPNQQAEKNPALGLRGIRLSLKDKQQFRLQIRALLRAGHGNNLDIVLPMVSDVGEIQRVKEVIRAESEELARLGVDYDLHGLGAMIEVPSMIFHIDEVLEQVDFVNIGTNDLVQYLLAVDRDNDIVADLFDTLHPSFLRALKVLFTAADKAGKEAVVCGEMAGSSLYVPLLTGLGARCLSMNPASIDRIANLIEQISVQEACEMANEVLKCSTARDAEETLRHNYRKYWPHIARFSASFSKA
jgi:phosphoenolpyruvate-protein phosphotransferase